MKNEIATIIVSGLLLCGIDSIYLKTIYNHFNKLVNRVTGNNIKFNMLGAVLCYIFLVGGLNYFVLLDKRLDNNEKLLRAAILGLVIYGVYETTNYALIKGWSFDVVVIDSVWGAILLSLTTVLTIYIMEKLKLKN
jgi:uncharacterized membrane protein